MSRFWSLGTATALLSISVLYLPVQSVTAQVSAPAVFYLDQGDRWGKDQRSDFYGVDQGSEMIPLSWLKALTEADGKPFMRDQFQRYGYLANPYADRNYPSTEGLPIGFTIDGFNGKEMVGMTCSACHTRDLEADGQRIRVDGGPALSDFQGFLTDMIDAVGRVLASDAAFDAFAASVLGADRNPNATADLRDQVALWYLRENTMRAKAYGAAGMWGLGRLDAVSMIFNRLTGLDIGENPAHLIASNIQPADAPVRYPFLWNASRQDITQWPGFALNGNDLLALARNVGEVYGVFGIYRPKKIGKGKIDFLADSSLDWDGLRKAEALIKRIGAPKWPWDHDPALEAAGKLVWNKPSRDGQSCASCHDVRKGAFRGIEESWLTPVMNVGTDTREWQILERSADSGVLAGAKQTFLSKPVGKTATQFSLLAFSVTGSILQDAFSDGLPQDKRRVRQGEFPAKLKDVIAAFSDFLESKDTKAKKVKPVNVYESRVLYGIWAAAPYLHNGSVPTLADLLKPAAERPTSFAMGRNYDKKRLGISDKQDGGYVMKTTGCDALASGNSNCGHEYGTEFSDLEKAALLEYLKML